MGFELYENCLPLSEEGLYILDASLLIYQHAGALFYDDLCQQEIFKEEKLENLIGSYLLINEIVVRDKNLKVVKLDINIDNDLLENFMGDGVLISTSSGSTAHNLSYGGSIVYPTFSSLQITPMGPINSKAYKSLVNSVIVPDKKEG